MEDEEGRPVKTMQNALSEPGARHRGFGPSGQTVGATEAEAENLQGSTCSGREGGLAAGMEWAVGM